MELKHKIQDLLDNGIIEIEDPNDSPKEKLDVITKHDQNNTPMSSKAPYVASISSIMPSSPKTSQQQSIPSPSNNEPNGETSHIDPQGLSIVQIQAKPFFYINPLYDLDILDPMPSCTPIPIIPTLQGPIQNASPSCKNMSTF